jgi:hypothetical protein
LIVSIYHDEQGVEDIMIRKALLAAIVLCSAFYMHAVVDNSNIEITQLNSQPQKLTHWMTISSKKRHNSGCRYFKKSKGRMCTKSEGVACKICGG